MMKQTRLFSSIVLITLLVSLASCGGQEDPFYPKPRGFYRIELPEKKYQAFDSAYPFSFRIPVYAHIEPVESQEPGVIWFNLVFPAFKGSVNFSYKPVNGNLYQLSEDAREFANKHMAKANEIREMRISHANNKVYGLAYDIEGASSASPYQFFITDSTRHYLRAAVYFNHSPNNDSIAPIISRVKEDLDTLIGSFRWK